MNIIDIKKRSQAITITPIYGTIKKYFQITQLPEYISTDKPLKYRHKPRKL